MIKTMSKGHFSISFSNQFRILSSCYYFQNIKITSITFCLKVMIKTMNKDHFSISFSNQFGALLSYYYIQNLKITSITLFLTYQAHHWGLGLKVTSTKQGVYKYHYHSLQPFHLLDETRTRIYHRVKFKKYGPKSAIT